MFNFVKSLIGKEKSKSNKMEEVINNIEERESAYKNLDFQWIKGEKIGSVEKYKRIINNGENYFVEFQSGERMNLNLIDEWMYTFPAEPIDFSSNYEKPLPNTPGIAEIPSSSVTEIFYTDDQQKRSDKDSPIYKLLVKQKENMVDVSIKIKLNLPPRDLYSVLVSSFDDAEKEIIEFVLDSVDIEDIKKSLSNSIKKSYYNTNKKDSEKESSENKK